MLLQAPMAWDRYLYGPNSIRPESHKEVSQHTLKLGVSLGFIPIKFSKEPYCYTLGKLSR